MWSKDCDIFSSIMLHNFFDPGSIVRNLGESIDLLAIMWFEGGGYNPICISIFTHQWTTRISLEVHSMQSLLDDSVLYMTVDQTLFAHVRKTNVPYLGRSLPQSSNASPRNILQWVSHWLPWVQKMEICCSLLLFPIQRRNMILAECHSSCLLDQWASQLCWILPWYSTEGTTRYNKYIYRT